jgi:hypothetical protein
VFSLLLAAHSVTASSNRFDDGSPATRRAQAQAGTIRITIALW